MYDTLQTLFNNVLMHYSSCYIILYQPTHGLVHLYSLHVIHLHLYNIIIVFVQHILYVCTCIIL